MNRKLISIAAATLLSALSIGAQAQTTGANFNTAPFALGGGASEIGGGGDPFARLSSNGESLTYSFTLASVSDVVLSFFYTGGSNGRASVNWTGPLSGNVTLATGSSSTTLLGSAGNANTNPGSTSSFATYIGDNLAAGVYSFKITSTATGTSNTNRFNIDDFSANVTAVPEPETYAMMLAGLGAIGFMSRRRKKAQG
jgi:hypothetical protein